ncbi:DoxX family protein [Mucilaginibacter limnophilus]|uniref:DoxX family protein n=1 Tax=Mucilaginibacter limnophilus TaxID=1932778 RepID=A0A437MQA8_9SPHI|nr:DoxX family protein [Mucilaginibacter limnophilus]RVT99817.1 DoxX family protein [Mucilaginibacter limnophilus]
MNMVQKVEHWGDLHHAKWLDVIRVILGLIILVKGIEFASEVGSQHDLISSANKFGFSGLASMAIVHTVALAHIVGGLMIAFGLLTRLAVVIQMPILLGAIFFVNLTRNFTFFNSELWLSIIVFMLLVLFWIVGSGPYSVDNMIKLDRQR